MAEVQAPKGLHEIHAVLVKLYTLQNGSDDLWLLDPVWHAAQELDRKLKSAKCDVHRSSKLYRAIDDIESTALLMPRYKPWRKTLSGVATELRRISGWREGE